MPHTLFISDLHLAPDTLAANEALLKFLGAKESTAVKDNRLGGRIDQVVPLILDSVYHALR